MYQLQNIDYIRKLVDAANINTTTSENTLSE